MKYSVIQTTLERSIFLYKQANVHLALMTLALVTLDYWEPTCHLSPCHLRAVPFRAVPRVVTSLVPVRPPQGMHQRQKKLYSGFRGSMALAPLHDI